MRDISIFSTSSVYSQEIARPARARSIIRPGDLLTLKKEDLDWAWQVPLGLASCDPTLGALPLLLLLPLAQQPQTLKQSSH